MILPHCTWALVHSYGIILTKQNKKTRSLSDARSQLFLVITENDTVHIHSDDEKDLPYRKQMYKFPQNTQSLGGAGDMDKEITHMKREIHFGNVLETIREKQGHSTFNSSFCIYCTRSSWDQRTIRP